MINIANVASTKSALNYVIEYCSKRINENIQILVPDKLSLFMERYLFERLDIGASFNLRVSTLNRFVKRRNPISLDAQISKTGSIILIHKILNELRTSLKVMCNKSYSFTYAENIYNTIAQLKSSKINYDEMLSFNSNNDALRDKIHDIGLVFERYERDKAGLLDQSDTFLSSAMFINDDLRDTTIVIIGFDDFTAIEYSLLERMAIHGKELIVMNLANKSGNKYIYNNEVLSQMKNIAYINELGFKVQDYYNNGDNISSYLENNLFSVKPSKFELTKNSVKVFTGSRIEEELEFVARDIREKIISGNRGDAFGVAVFNLESNTKLIEEIFSKYEINYYLDSKFTMDNSIYFKFIASLIKYSLEGYEATHLIDIINSPFVNIDKDNKKAFIDKLLVYKYRGKLDKFEVDDTLIDIKQKIIEILNIIAVNKDTKIEDFINNIKILNENLNVSEVLINLAENHVNVRDKILINTSVDNVFKIFDEIKRFYSSASINDIYDIFIKVARTMKVNNLPLTVDAVKIIDAENVLEIFDDLYIINANSDNAPTMKYDCGIILDSEIEELNFKHKLAPTIAFINRLSKLRLFNSALMFNKNLSLTYSKKPSVLIDEVLKRFVLNIRGVEYKLESINKYVLDNRPLSRWDFVEKLCKNNKNIVKNHKNIIKNCKNNEFIEKILNNNIHNLNVDDYALYDDLISISASTLENYFKCPFYAFLNNTIKIKPRLDNDIKSLDVGNILHEIMFKYYRYGKNVGDVTKFCEREINGYIEKNDRLKLSINSPVIQNLIRESVRVLNGLDYIDNKTDFVPTYFEYEFKDKSFDDRVSLIGKVDRVDISPSGLRVIDYKSGRAEASLKELYYGNKLQLFMYSQALEKKLNKLAVGNFYLPLHNKYEINENENPYILKGFFVNDINVIHDLDNTLNPGEKSDVVNLKMNKEGLAYKYGKALEEQEYNNLKNYSYLVSRQALAEIKSGNVVPSPSEVSKPCNYCPYKSICMKDSNGIDYRPAKKINIDSFKENI